MNLPRTLLCALALGLAAMLAPASSQAARDAPAASLPGDSLYQLDAALTDQDGRALRFAAGRGEPRLVSMFYTACPYMCPLLIDTIRKTERELPADARGRLKVLLVSFDAEHDTPTALKALAEKRHLDTPRWTLARADASDVRRIAALLGIPYRRLQDGHFSHAGVLVLLDADGRVVARSETMGRVDPEFAAAAGRLLAAGPRQD